MKNNLLRATIFFLLIIVLPLIALHITKMLGVPIILHFMQMIYFLLLLIAIIQVGLIIYYLLTKKSAKAKALTVFCCSVVISAAIGLIAVKFIPNQNANSGKVIAESLSAYCMDHREFPNSINDLVPTYLDQIPNSSLLFKPKYEQQYFIRVSSTNGQILYGDDQGSAYAKKEIDIPENNQPYERRSVLTLYPGFYWHGETLYGYDQQDANDTNSFSCIPKINPGY